MNANLEVIKRSKGQTKKMFDRFSLPEEHDRALSNFIHDRRQNGGGGIEWHLDEVKEKSRGWGRSSGVKKDSESFDEGLSEKQKMENKAQFAENLSKIEKASAQVQVMIKTQLNNLIKLTFFLLQ